MAKISQIILPRAFASLLSSRVLKLGEIVFDQNLDLIRLGDGVTPGGRIIIPGISVNLDAAAFGLKGDGSANSMSAFRAWMAAGAAIVAAGGRPIMRANGIFRCAMDATHGTTFGERKAIRASGLHNALFDCAGATWLFDSADLNTNYANVFNLENSDNVSGHFGTVDWLKKPYAQGSITKGADYIDIALDAGFAPAFNQVQRIEVYNRGKINQGKILTKGFGGGGDVAGWPVTYPSAGVMRVSFTGSAEGLAYLATLANGDLVVAVYRVYGADGFRFIRCRNLDAQVKVVTTGGMACRVNEPENSAVAVNIVADSTGLVSSTADGLHVAAGRGFLDVRGSVRHTGDDPLNITNDSYVITSVSAPRTFVISSGYPYILPRVGDGLTGVNDVGSAIALGKVVSINTNTGQIVMDTDLPVGFATTWQAVNLSAFPITTFAETFIAEKCRGNVRSQVPSMGGRVRATDLTGNVTIEYIPYFTGEGIPPNATTLDVEAVRCGALFSVPGAISVQAFQIDGGGYADVGAISKPVINAVVRETRNSALFLAGVSYGCISLVTDRCCQNPAVGTYALANKQVAMINCDNINFPYMVELGASAGQVGTSGTATNLRYGSKLNYA